MPDSERTVPGPAPMPLDRERWRSELNLSNFVNTYYQYRDLQRLPGCRSVLIAGPGQGLDTQVLRWRGYDVTTFDIDETFQPDHVGSVHDLSIFADARFDAVIASHVLEHMAVPYLEPALRELARVARFSLVYLPVHGRHVQTRFVPGIRGWDFSFVIDLFNPLRKPDGVTARYMQGQHFWEMGMRGFRLKDMLRRFESHFEILSSYRNRDWLPSHNFVLASRRWRQG